MENEKITQGEIKILLPIAGMLVLGVLAALSFLSSYRGSPILSILVIFGYIALSCLCGYKQLKTFIILFSIAEIISVVLFLLPVSWSSWYIGVPVFFITAPMLVLNHVYNVIVPGARQYYTTFATAILFPILYLLPYFYGRHRQKINKPITKEERRIYTPIIGVVLLALLLVYALPNGYNSKPSYSFMLILVYTALSMLCGHLQSKAILVYFTIAELLSIVLFLMPLSVTNLYLEVLIFSLTAPMLALSHVCSVLAYATGVSMLTVTLELYLFYITAILFPILYFLPYFFARHKRKGKDEVVAQAQK